MNMLSTPRVNARHCTAVFAMAIALTACGSSDNKGGGTGGSGATAGTGGSGATAGTGGSGGGSFTPATQPSDVCGMLTLADAQSLLPGATAGVEQPSPDTTNLGFWSVDCKWDSSTSSNSIELVVFRALTKDGLNSVKLAAQSGDVNTPVTGLGDEAHYWQETAQGTSGLWALKGSYSVDVTAYFIKPFPPETQFHPLVEKALGQL